MANPLLILEGLAKRFGELAVLNDVNASVQEGAITALVGPNGAGKTTLFHVISGDLRPDSGRVMFDGHAIAGRAPWRIARLGVGKLFQDVRLFDEMTVIENVLLPLYGHETRSPLFSLVHGFGNSHERQLREQACTLLSHVGVEPPYDRAARLLSFGNRKLVALARLMAGRFRLLLLDEPTAGLSPAMIDRVSIILSELAHSGTTILLIEHNYSFVLANASEVYVMSGGSVSDVGSAAEVMQRADNREVLIGI